MVVPRTAPCKKKKKSKSPFWRKKTHRKQQKCKPPNVDWSSTTAPSSLLQQLLGLLTLPLFLVFTGFWAQPVGSSSLVLWNLGGKLSGFGCRKSAENTFLCYRTFCAMHWGFWTSHFECCVPTMVMDSCFHIGLFSAVLGETVLVYLVRRDCMKCFSPLQTGMISV